MVDIAALNCWTIFLGPERLNHLTIMKNEVVSSLTANSEVKVMQKLHANDTSRVVLIP